MAPLKNSFPFFGKLCQFFEISIILHLTKSLMIFAFSSVNMDLLTWCSYSKLSFIQQRSNGKGLVTSDFLHYNFFFLYNCKETHEIQDTKDFNKRFYFKIAFVYIIEIIYHISYTRNNYSNICIVLGALKLLLCFSLDIDINDTLNYRTNYLLRKKQSQINRTV